MSNATQRLAIITSHVIQYQGPFFRLLAQEPGVDLTVIFCSPAGAETVHDREMSTTLRWDVDLTTGYRSRVLRNFGPANLAGGFFRLINPGIVPALVRGRYDAVIFMLGWGSFTAMLGIATCIAARIPFFLYGDSSFPPPEDSLRAKIRAAFLRRLFRSASGFMTSGVLNADYYAHYGATHERFFLLPWAVDNDRFVEGSRFAPGEREALRARYGIGADRVVVLFSAKLLPRKDPMTLLRAVAAQQHRNRVSIVFLGEGALRGELEAFAREHQLDAHFPGFVNQADLPKHYAMADVFVLPSTYEPRGAVLNEAMACGLPVVVTDRCGSIGDIVQENDNAFVFPAGDAAALARVLDTLVADDELRARMSRRSREIIATWDFRRGVDAVRKMLEAVAK